MTELKIPLINKLYGYLHCRLLSLRFMSSLLKIIFNILGILNVNHVGVFVTSYVGVIISVVVIYALMYWVTSRIYYMIVNRYH